MRPSEAPHSVPGDLTGDGEVTVGDAVVALRAALGQITLTPLQVAAGDVTPRAGPGKPFGGKGKVTSDDVAAILRLAVGLQDEP